MAVLTVFKILCTQLVVGSKGSNDYCASCVFNPDYTVNIGLYTSVLIRVPMPNCIGNYATTVCIYTVISYEVNVVVTQCAAKLNLSDSMLYA